MIYTDVITRFWEYHKKVAFPHIDIALFLFLAHEWNLRGQLEWFGIETRYLEISVPISRKSLVFSRERLRERGLIDYETKGGRGTTQYMICVSSVNTTGNTNETQSDFCVSDSVSLRNTKPFVLPEETLRETQTETPKKKPFPPYPPIKKNIYSTPTSLNSVNDNINDNNEKILSGMDVFSIGEIVARLKESTEWKESMMRTFGIGESELYEKLDCYPDHCTTLGETRKTINEAKRHFTNWLRKLKQSPITNETKREDRFSERRGTDPAANRAEDYTSTF